MRISHKYKFIFFSNPRTGSTTVRALLDPFSDIRSTNNVSKTQTHISPKRVRDIFLNRNWDYDGYYKFVFVRNPWARLISLYAWLSKSYTKLPFAEWLYTINVSGKEPRNPKRRLGPIYGMSTIDAFVGDRSFVNKIIRLEDINVELIPVLQTIGMPNTETLVIPHLAQREGNKPYEEYYDDEMIEHVRMLYAKDIAEFNYSFGS